MKCFGSRDAGEILVRLWINPDIWLSHTNIAYAYILKQCHSERMSLCWSKLRKREEKPTERLFFCALAMVTNIKDLCVCVCVCVCVYVCVCCAAGWNRADFLQSSEPLDDGWICAVFT